MHSLSGHYRDGSGFLSPGRLLVEKTENGFRDPETCEALCAREYRVSQSVIEVEIPQAYFVPSAGECGRIGMPVTRL
jgi:hypothetical protein